MRMHGAKYLKKAVRIAGGQSALARACGGNLRQQHIWNWLNRDAKVPAEYVRAIERATDGRIKRHQLRPDIYPPHEQAGPASGRAGGGGQRRRGRSAR